MRYQKFAPPNELLPFVECLFTWEGVAPEKVEVQSPPSGFGAIVFNYGDPTWAYQNSEEVLPVPNAFACGIFTSNYHRVLLGRIGMFGIVFKPCAIHNFFGLRMSTLVNSRIPLGLLPGVHAQEMLVQTIAHKNTDDLVQIVSQLLLPRLTEATTRVSIIDDAVDFISQKNGSVSVEDVATRFRISKRYLEKQFLIKVGVSPKFYSRIKRFGTLSNKVAHSEKVDWLDVAFDSGFHDQSHLVKEFMEFNKLSPSEYHKKHQEMTRFLK
jgi:AraC-like DNA-binding protein